MYRLYDKDRYVASFELTGDVLGSPLRIVEHGSAPMPLGVQDEDFAAWLDSRKASRHNGRLLRLMRELGCDRLEGFIAATHAASLVDTYWVREESETLTWRDVSLYRNSFEETMSKLDVKLEGTL